jgi:predicted nucleotidyltransferase
MKNLSEIQSIVRAHALELHQRFGIASLAVFGSVARGEAKEESDVDILAVFDRSIGLLALCSAENYLIELLGIDVDLIPREDVRPELRDQIYSEAVAI